MPRKNRIQSSSGVYHWINRGITKKDLFHKAPDYDFFLKLLAEYKNLYNIHIYHYCLMTNHVHLLINAPSTYELSKFSQYVQRRYAYYYSKIYHWGGGIFQGRYKSLPVDKDTYLLECGRYIERNPIKAGLGNKPEEYPYSSYRYYAEGEEDALITASPAYLDISGTPYSRQELYRNYVTELRSQEILETKDKIPF